jgi:hypothetical protein
MEAPTHALNLRDKTLEFLNYFSQKPFHCVSNKFLARLAMPTVMWEQRKIEHGFTPILVALREVLEHFFFEFADMTVGVKHSPLAHGCLQNPNRFLSIFSTLGCQMNGLASLLSGNLTIEVLVR